MAKVNHDFFKKKNDWSIIKDELLACYLTVYFSKVLTTNRPIIYIDCFAGKGKFDDGNDGSPRITLRIRNESINRSRNTNAKILMYFIEPTYTSELESNISMFDNQYGRPIVVKGKFEENIEDLLNDKTDKNIFLYIDPFGVKSLDMNLFQKISDIGFNSIEMLINLNSFGFMRFACSAMKIDYSVDEPQYDLVEYEPVDTDDPAQLIKLANKIAGGDYWQEIVKNYYDKKIDGYLAEETFSNEYKNHLKKKYKYVLDMPISIKQNHHPKYRMVHVSNHEAGCLLMADNMISRSNKLTNEVQNKGQLSFFDSDILGGDINENAIQNNIVSLMQKFPDGITLDIFCAEFYSEYGVICPSKIIRKLLKKLESINEIEVNRYPVYTKLGKLTTFFTEDRSKNQIVRLRRLKT